jgi:two-component system, NtrC family, response regulator AtoC
MAETLLGDSAIIHRVSEQLQKAALTEIPVLITGESGTGKELAARLLHDLSVRSAHKFIKVNCPAITNQAFESALLGREPSSFTGVAEAKTGECEQADKGTLFLDEIAELDLTLQAILLHALEGFQVMSRAGNDRVIDTRIICATNRDLELEVAKGRFRIDLFHRINVLGIRMPSLRERPCDVPILMNHFIMVYGERFGGRPAPLSASFTKLLEVYHWPGNIRELENLAKRYVVLGGEEHIISVLREPGEITPLVPDVIDLTNPLRVQIKRSVQCLERKIILGVLQEHKWNCKKTARSLDISYRALLYKIKSGGLAENLVTHSKFRKPLS